MLTRSKTKRVHFDNKYVEHIKTLDKIAQGLLSDCHILDVEKHREIIKNYENIIRCLLNIDYDLY
jgi:hypothetical protein